MTFRPHDVVALQQSLPEHNLLEGTRGTIVMVYREPTLGYEVEFVDERGETLAVETLNASVLEAVATLVWRSPDEEGGEERGGDSEEET